MNASKPNLTQRNYVRKENHTAGFTLDSSSAYIRFVETKSQGERANPGSPGRMTVKQVCVYN